MRSLEPSVRVPLRKDLGAPSRPKDSEPLGRDPAMFAQFLQVRLMRLKVWRITDLDQAQVSLKNKTKQQLKTLWLVPPSPQVPHSHGRPGTDSRPRFLRARPRVPARAGTLGGRAGEGCGLGAAARGGARGAGPVSRGPLLWPGARSAAGGTRGGAGTCSRAPCEWPPAALAGGRVHSSSQPGTVPAPHSAQAHSAARGQASKWHWSSGRPEVWRRNEEEGGAPRSRPRGPAASPLPRRRAVLNCAPALGTSVPTRQPRGACSATPEGRPVRTWGVHFMSRRRARVHES